MGMVLIETIEVGAGGALEMVFSSIPQTGVDLLLVTSTRLISDGTSRELSVAFNGIVGNGGGEYRSIALSGTTTLTQGNSFQDARTGVQNRASSATNSFGMTNLRIPNYASSELKVWSYETGEIDSIATTQINRHGGGWLTRSDPITSLTVRTVFSSPYDQFSKASLYMTTAD
jgi:hypothetical protein